MGTKARGAASPARTHRTRNQSEDKYAGRFVARPALRRADVEEESWLHHSNGAHARVGHRREYRHLQPDQCGATPNAAGQRAAATGGLHHLGPQGTDNSYSYRQVERFNQANHSFMGIIAAGMAERRRMAEPGAGGQVEAVQATRVSGNFFSALGVGAVAGQTLTEDDDKASSPQPVAVISYKFWKSRFGLDPGVVGRKITLDDFPFTIVGVAPPGFFGIEVGRNTDLWWPIRMTPQVIPGDQSLSDGHHRWLYLMARLKPSVNLEQAQAEMNAVFRQQLNEIGPEWLAKST